MDNNASGDALLLSFLFFSLCRDDLVIKAGSEAGALLVDGLGDGILLEAEDQDFEFLRTTSFGMLQGCRMRNTKTVGSRSLLCTLFRDSCSNVKSHVHNSTLELWLAEFQPFCLFNVNEIDHPSEYERPSILWSVYSMLAHSCCSMGTTVCPLIWASNFAAARVTSYLLFMLRIVVAFLSWNGIFIVIFRAFST